MKAVLLDWATMGPGLDLSELRTLLPDLDVYEETDDDQIADRIAGAEIVIGNKVLISESLFGRKTARCRGSQYSCVLLAVRCRTRVRLLVESRAQPQPLYD